MIELYVFWCVFAILEGVREGATFAHNAACLSWPYNIHKYFMLTRVWTGAYLVYIFGINPWYDSVTFAASLALAFSFWHNGAQYITRRKKDYPTYHFFSESTTTNARFSFGPWERSIQFAFSLLLLLWLYRWQEFLRAVGIVFV